MTKFSICNCANRSGEIELGNVDKNTNYEVDGKTGHTFCQNVKYYVREFCIEGTIHGIKYIGEKRTLLEKIWWLITIGISLYFCVTLTIAIYDKWENAPVIVSFATTETPIWQVPFPVVTLCPETKSRPSVFNYTKYLFMKKQNLTLEPEIERKFGYLSMICAHEPEFNYQSRMHFAEEDIFDFFDEVQPKFYDDISDCKFMGIDQNCSELFHPIITDEGICYSFNILDRYDLMYENVVQYKNYHVSPNSNGWTLEQGYPLSSPVDTYPRRALFYGASHTLEAKLTVYEDDMDFYCGSSLQGYKAQISHPSRMPRVKEQHFQVPIDQKVIAVVLPDMMTTSEVVKNYKPSRRNCYFPSEGSLKYFKLYSGSNCQIECKSNYTEHKCGCVNYYMPRHNTTNICDAGSYSCMQEAEKELMFEGIAKKLRKLRGEPKASSNEFKCNCLPICTSMYFKVETSQSDWDWKKKYQTNETSSSDGKRNRKHMSYLQVFFKHNQFITSERNELFGLTDFLASFGGLLGLFVGFSMLSLIEVFYYLTLRIICNVYMFGAKNWSGKKNC